MDRYLSSRRVAAVLIAWVQGNPSRPSNPLHHGIACRLSRRGSRTDVRANDRQFHLCRDRWHRRLERRRKRVRMAPRRCICRACMAGTPSERPGTKPPATRDRRACLCAPRLVERRLSGREEKDENPSCRAHAAVHQRRALAAHLKQELETWRQLVREGALTIE